MNNYRKSVLLGAALFLLVTGLLGIYLHFAYEQDKRAVEERVSRTSFLIGEWVRGAFLASDYVLRDIVSQIPVTELRYPHPDPVRQAELTDFLVSKLKTLPFAVGVGLADKHCIITHTWSPPPRPSVLGFDGSSREWCRMLRDKPQLESFVTNAMMSTTGKKTVLQMRRYPLSIEGRTGLAGVSVEFDFFANWLEKISVDRLGIVAIFDLNRVLLARKPALPEQLGESVKSSELDAFLASGDSDRLVSALSPVDGEKRMYSVRKVEGLPFVIVVGEAESVWLASWWQGVWVALAGLGLVGLMVALSLHYYWIVLRQSEELALKANTDQLTGVVSRRHFTELAAREIHRARRHGIPVGLMLLDVDHFKEINDRHGHAVGDQALVAVAETCRNSLRDIDILARLGGDEFIVLLPEIPAADVALLAERIRQAISETHFETSKGSPITLTTSIGVAHGVGETTPDLNELLEQADALLYRSKQSGRNIVSTKEG